MSLTKKLLTFGTAALLSAGAVYGAVYYFKDKNSYTIKEVPAAIQEQIQQEKAAQRQQEEEQQRLREQLHMTEVDICGKKVRFPESAYLNELLGRLNNNPAEQNSVDGLWGNSTGISPGGAFAAVNDITTTLNNDYNSAHVTLSFYFGQLSQINFGYAATLNFDFQKSLEEVLNQPESGESTCRTGVEFSQQDSQQHMILYSLVLRPAQERTSAFNLLTTPLSTFSRYECPSSETIRADVHPSPGDEMIQLLCRDGSPWPEGFRVYDANNTLIADNNLGGNMHLYKLSIVNLLTDSIAEIQTGGGCIAAANCSLLSVFKFKGNELHPILNFYLEATEIDPFLRRIFSRNGRSIAEISYEMGRVDYLYNRRRLQFERQP